MAKIEGLICPLFRATRMTIRKAEEEIIFCDTNCAWFYGDSCVIVQLFEKCREARFS